MESGYNDSWFNNKSKEDVIREIKELRKNIRRKHRALKRETMDTEELWEKQLKPIAEPLKKLVNEGQQQQQQQLQQQAVKNERKRKINSYENEEIAVKRYAPPPLQGVKRKQKLNLPTLDDFESDYEYDDGTVEIPAAKRQQLEGDEDMQSESEQNVIIGSEEEPPSTPVLHQPMEYNETVYESRPSGQQYLKTPQGRHMAKQYIENQFRGNLAKEYFFKLITDSKDIDHNYGIRVEGDSWMIGDKPIDLDRDDLIIDGKRHEGTRGLYELLFMNKPNEYVYDEQDLINYAIILEQTNVHRVNYSAIAKVKSNKGYKYKNIISKIIKNKEKNQNPMMRTYDDDLQSKQRDHVGSGILLTDSKPNIVYYDDPNEIVNRLRILLASQEAGNTGHTNEINAILEELYELEPDLSQQLK